MIIRMYIFFWIAAVIPLLANAGESPFSPCELRTRGFTADNMEFVDTPENFKISSETGIQILALKRPLPYQTMKGRLLLEPVRLRADKIDLTNDVAKFLEMFPRDFLIKNQNICFILVDDIQDDEAMATKNVIFLPVDASFEAIAHEFMHAVDDLHEGLLSYEQWDEAAGTCRYNPNVDIDRPFPAGSADEQCFVTPYAKTNLWEDRAEIFSALYRNQLSASAPEPVLKKAEELKKFFRDISPSVSESFWNRQREFSR